MSEVDQADQAEQLLGVDARGRVRTSTERREAILDEFERSGVSGAAFARLHGIKYATFANWIQKRRQQRRQTEGAPASSSRPLRLAEVVVGQPWPNPAEPGAEALRLELPAGAALTISNRGQARLAAELLRELASC